MGQRTQKTLEKKCFFKSIGSILCCSESGDDDDTQENLARYGYNLNTKLENLK